MSFCCHKSFIFRRNPQNGFSILSNSEKSTQKPFQTGGKNAKSAFIHKNWISLRFCTAITIKIYIVCIFLGFNTLFAIPLPSWHHQERPFHRHQRCLLTNRAPAQKNLFAVNKQTRVYSFYSFLPRTQLLLKCQLRLSADHRQLCLLSRKFCSQVGVYSIDPYLKFVAEKLTSVFLNLFSAWAGFFTVEIGYGSVGWKFVEWKTLHRNFDCKHAFKSEKLSPLS